MCLAIPAKVTEMKDNRLATVDILGVTRDKMCIRDRKKSARSIPTHRTAWWAFGSRMRRC